MSLLKIAAAAMTVLIVAGCATTDHGKSVAESTPDTFVKYACENGKSFSARFSTESATVRVRTLDGSAELSEGRRGLYRDPAGQWLLRLGAASSTELIFKGFTTHTQCSVIS